MCFTFDIVCEKGRERSLVMSSLAEEEAEADKSEEEAKRKKERKKHVKVASFGKK